MSKNLKYLKKTNPFFQKILKFTVVFCLPTKNAFSLVLPFTEISFQSKVSCPPHVFGHGWLCHPTFPRGQFSENFNLSTGFVIQEVKVQTLIHFYDSLNQ